MRPSSEHGAPFPGVGEPPAPRSRELDVALGAARAAARVALAHLGSGAFETKADASIVTEADREAERAARATIAAAFPGAVVVGEETAAEEGPLGLERGDCWVIDPIDGTASYAVSLPTFGVSVGLLRNGTPLLGVFLLPRTDEVYACDAEGPAFHGTRPAVAIEPETVDARAFLCVTSMAHVEWNVSFPGKTRSLGSTALHVALVARGAAAGAIVEPAIWDVAAVLPILRRAGGDFFALDDGAPLDVAEWLASGDRRRTFLAASRGFAPILRSFVRRR